MKNKKIVFGIAKETKKPIDNRVLFTPEQILHITKEYPSIQFIVQPSNVRAYADSEYLKLGIDVSENLSACDYIFGIKEVDPGSLLFNKHYFFFGLRRHLRGKGKDFKLDNFNNSKCITSLVCASIV